MGSVWLAEHVLLKRRTAIKILHPSFAAQTDIVNRFFNEAKAATAIADPGIVQVFDFGHHTDGSAYLVMELLDGEPLDKRVERAGTLPVGDALRVVRQVASSLGAAHATGIVHRDLKPENIFLVKDPEVVGGERAKILDFGIAKLAVEPGAMKTSTHALMGTPTFMSPEQCRGAGFVDARSDIYSLGCVLFNLLVGRPPFQGQGVGEIISQHMNDPAPRAVELANGIPPEVDALIARCLAKEPATRFANGKEMAAAVEALIGAHGSAPAARAIAPLPSQPMVATTLSSAASAAPTMAPERRTGLWLGIGAVIAAGGVAVAVIKSGGASSETTAAEPPKPPDTRSVESKPVEPKPVEPKPVETKPAATAVEPRPDPATVKKLDDVHAQLASFVAAFVRWSSTHASSPCPSAVELAKLSRTPVIDPWRQQISITCTEQPPDQLMGAVSLGPDGVRSADDVASWTLGAEVTGLVRGPRWNPTVAAGSTRRSPPARPATGSATPVTEPPKPEIKPDPKPEPKPEPEPATKPALGSNGLPPGRTTK